MRKNNSKWKLITFVAMIFVLCLSTIPEKDSDGKHDTAEKGNAGCLDFNGS